MSLVIPDAAAMSSIEVAAYPVRAKAAAAPCRIDSWRAARGSGPVGVSGCVSVTTGILSSIHRPVYNGGDAHEQPAADLDRGRAPRDRRDRRAARRRGRAVPWWVRRRRQLPLAAHAVPRARDRRVAAAPSRAVGDRAARRPTVDVARDLPE